MAQYARVAMPEARPFDLAGNLLELMKVSEASQQMKIRSSEEAAKETGRQQIVSDRSAVDAAFAPTQDRTNVSTVTQQPATDDTLPSTQRTGYMSAPGATRPRSRDEILASVPGHLRPLIQKQFTDADNDARVAQKSILELAEANRKAVTDVNEHLAGLAYAAAQWKYDPGAVGVILDHAKETYSGQPEMLKRIDGIAAQVEKDPESIKPIAQTLIGQSERYSKLMQKEGATNELELAAIAANDPDEGKRAAAQKTLDTLAKFKVSSTNQPQGRQYTPEQAHLNAWASAKGYDSADAMPPEEHAAARVSWENSTRKPESDATRAATLTQRATAERWKADELDKLEKQYKNSQPVAIVQGGEPRKRTDTAGNVIEPMTAAELTAAKARIQTSYLQQIGSAPAAPAPTGQPKTAPAGGEKFQVGQVVTLKDGTKYTIKEVSPDGTKFR